MNFGLDYDGVCTGSGLDLWLEWVKLAKLHGHKVYIVTMRFLSECSVIPESLTQFTEGVYPTGRMAKKPHMGALGIKIHVWIDDHPEAIHKNAIEIWGVIASEGEPVVASYD